MKTRTLMALLGSLALVACHGTGPHNHAHEEHDPAVETHLHEHETPEEHEAHGHEAEAGHGHAGEISLPAERPAPQASSWIRSSAAPSAR